MENPLAYVHKGHSNFSSSLFPFRSRQPCAMNINIPCSHTTGTNCYERFRRQQLLIKQLRKAVVNCAKGGGPRVPEEEIITEEELLGFGRLRENCKEETANGGIAELLECMEREAIMGEDEGKEPTDYNRRAQIFHKSSRVFQALKEGTNTTTPTATTS